MQSVVLFKPNEACGGGVVGLGQLTMDGLPLAVGLMECMPASFDPTAPENYNRVLLEVLAFSCNYRDRGIIHRYLNSEASSPLHFGSDFVAVVRAVGRNVRSLVPGERVVGNNSYPLAGAHEPLQGVPTNAASDRFLVVHESKAVRTPETMPLFVAAGFSIAAQTCYAMVRKLNVRRGDRCIVTGASSNTALFALRILAGLGAETYAVTTGSRDFGQFGVRGTIRVKPPVDDSIVRNEIAKQIVREHGGADIVLDCFADIYATSVLPLLRSGGKYITCGIFAQAGIEPRSGVSSARWRDLLAFVIMNNITIYGNCLGNDSDLRNAMADYANTNSQIQIDCVLGVENSLQFVDRSFACSDRFGKVIFRYDSSNTM